MAIVYAFSGDRKDFDKHSKLKLPRICSSCGGRMIRHGGYVRKTGVARVLRMLCKGCGITHAVLPHFLAPWKRVPTEEREVVVSGWALGQATGA